MSTEQQLLDAIAQVRNETQEEANSRVRISNLFTLFMAWVKEISTPVVPPPALAVTATKTDVTVNGGSNGSITATAQNGTGPFQFNRNGGAYQNSNVFSNLAAGVYTIGVKDSTGATATTPVTVGQPAPAPTYNRTLQMGGMESADGVYLNSVPNLVVKYNAKVPVADTSTPQVAIYFGSEPIGVLDYNVAYNGEPLVFIYNGNTYTKTFTNGNLTINA